MYHCPACGFELNGPPWRGEDPSWNICPCCGIEFGYDEYDSEFFDRREEFADEAQYREAFYRDWRARWRAAGCPWWSKQEGPPAGWSPEDQLARRGWT